MKLRLTQLFILLAFVQVFVVRAHAATYHVSPFGSNMPPYSSYETAANHPRDAIGLAGGYGDTLLIHAGTYDLDTTVVLPGGLTVQGVDRDSVILRWLGRVEAPPLPHVLRLYGDHEISGITVSCPQGYNVHALGALSGPGNLTIRDCHFVYCGFYGGCPGLLLIEHNTFQVSNIGIGVDLIFNVNAVIRYNRFRARLFSTPRCIRVHGGEVNVYDNVFDLRGSQLSTGIQVLESFSIFSEFHVHNNLFLGGRWALLCYYHRGSFDNNTLVNLTKTTLGEAPYGPLEVYNDFEGQEWSIRIRNNAFIDCEETPLFGVFVSDSATIGYTDNAFWPPKEKFWHSSGVVYRPSMIDTGNFNGYPMFVDDSLYRLQLGSPLIDAGDPAFLDPDGSRSDIGWTGGPGGMTYDYLDLPPLPPDTLSASGGRTLITLYWTSRPERDLGGYRLYRGYTTGFWMPGLDPVDEFGSRVTDTTLQLSSGHDSLYFVVTAFDHAGQESIASNELEWIISSHPLNRAPEWSAIPAQDVMESDTMSLHVTAFDPDNQSLDLRAVGLPANAAFTDSLNNSGLLWFSPDTTQAGDYEITLIASDGELSDTATVEITVTEREPHPLVPGIAKVYPNPTRGGVSVEIIVPGDAAQSRDVTLVLHDMLGRSVARCFEGNLPSGTQVVVIELDSEATSVDLASGVYFLRMQVGSETVGQLAKIAVVR